MTATTTTTTELEAPPTVAFTELQDLRPKGQLLSAAPVGPLGGGDVESGTANKSPNDSSPADGSGTDGTAEQAPAHATESKQRWNYPRSNTYRLSVCNLALFNLGLNDASFGALLPYIGRYYSLDYTLVSLLFLFPFVGYSIASLINSPLHTSMGQRGIAVIGPFARVVAYLVLSQHPPYGVVLPFLVVAGFGNGLIDAAWNAYVGDFAQANQLLGILHSFYGLGCTITPLIANAIVTQIAGERWWNYYYLPLASCAVEGLLGLWAFRAESGAEYRRRTQASQTSSTGGTATQSKSMAAIKNRVTWLITLFLFVYMGVEVSLGGWIVSFMLSVRHSDAFRSELAATGFWLGLTIGRLVLGFVTPLLGIRLAVTIYLGLAVVLELIFWLVPSFVVSAVAVALLGFAIGPLFPAAIVAATKLLPKHLHVPSIGFAAAFGGGGAAILPFVVGAIAQAKGVESLEPIALALLVALVGVWLLLPRFPKREHGE